VILTLPKSVTVKDDERMVHVPDGQLPA
jgi:hypothetical protein